MVPKTVIPAFLIIGALAAAPAWADQDNHRKGGEKRSQESGRQAPQGERATPRGQAQREQPRAEAPRQQPRNDVQPRAYEAPRRNDVQPRTYEAPRQQPRNEAQPRAYEAPRAQVQPRADVGRGYDRAVPREVPRDYDRRDGHVTAPYYGAPRYNYGHGYGYGHGYIAPRIIRPTIVTVIPYRPYVYRPCWSIGIYYGYNNYYPYGYTPRGYYDPIPGVPYGGLRITGVPRDGQVFADGYFVGIVDDFDGVFQHLNLEAGGHHIEIQLPGGYEAPLAFDVYIRPGETMTYRAGY